MGSKKEDDDNELSKEEEEKKRLKKLKKEKKKKRKSQESAASVDTLDHVDEEDVVMKENEASGEKDDGKKKAKKSKKESRRRSRSVDSEAGRSVSSAVDDDEDNDKDKDNASAKDDSANDPSALSRKERSQQKRKAKKSILEGLPKVNEDGIAYTKMQLRRMVKRVQNGLSPIPTAAEERERKEYEAKVQREEDILYFSVETPAKGAEDDDNDDDDNDDDDDDDDNDDQEHEDDNADDNEDKNDQDADGTSQKRKRDGDDTEMQTEGNENTPPAKPTKKKKSRSKPVPDDYTCQACKNACEPRHWIYDCPQKVTVRGRNQVAKKLRGLHDPDPRKVFVTGLPFDATMKGVIDLFQDQNCGPVASCKLLKFPDTKRCKGMGYVKFETEDGAQMALKLSGISIPASMRPDDKKKKSKKGKKKGSGGDADNEEDGGRKTLKLGVTKVVHRRATKGRKPQGGR